MTILRQPAASSAADPQSRITARETPNPIMIVERMSEEMTKQHTFCGGWLRNAASVSRSDPNLQLDIRKPARKPTQNIFERRHRQISRRSPRNFIRQSSHHGRSRLAHPGQPHVKFEPVAAMRKQSSKDAKVFSGNLEKRAPRCPAEEVESSSCVFSRRPRRLGGESL